MYAHRLKDSPNFLSESFGSAYAMFDSKMSDTLPEDLCSLAHRQLNTVSCADETLSIRVVEPP